MPGSGFQLFDGVNTGVERVLDLRMAQTTLVAGNLANADTPGYLAKEIPFKDLLSEVMESAIGGAEDLPDPNSVEVAERDALPTDLDGNSVDLEQQAGVMASNQVLYNALSTGVSRRLALLRFAASDGRG